MVRMIDQRPACRGERGPFFARVARRWFPDGFVALAAALPLLGFFLYSVHASYRPCRLEMDVAPDRLVDLQIYYDSGAGFDEAHPEHLLVAASQDWQRVRLPVPVDRLKAVRLKPANTPVVMRIGDLCLRTSFKPWLLPRRHYTFDLGTMRPEQPASELIREGAGVRLSALTPPPEGATFVIAPPQPLELTWIWSDVFLRTLAFAVGWLLLWGFGAEFCRRVLFRVPSLAGGPLSRVTRAYRWLSPVQAVWLVAAASVVLSCYPVIFCGQSFVSANFLDGTYQLYHAVPTLPGPANPQLENGEGTDLGAMAWAHGPYAVVQARAIFRDHELPLWHRYNQGGLPLLGQGQSMLGDPLHWLVIAAGGRAWAWDAKFILAKWLFAAGVGLLVLATAQSVPVALLLSFSAAFIGFFSYRLNHPAYFSLCYAPWILLAWVEIVRAASWRRALGWTGGLLLANWCELNSGTAKESAMLLLCLNLTGLLRLCVDRQSAGDKFRRLLGLAGAGLIFCLLAAPLLLTFFDTLARSVSRYDAPHAFQLQPGLLIGLFDDIFYRQMSLLEHKVDPAANFFVLFGVLFACAGFRRLVADRTFATVLACALPPLALVFGAVPASLIRATPFLANVYHIDNTFSCVLLVPLFVLAGFGLQDCLAQANRRVWKRDALTACLLGTALLGAYFGFLHAAHRADITFLKLDESIPVSMFFSWYVPTLTAALLPLPFVLRRLQRRGPEVATVILLAASLGVLHARHGLQVHTPLHAYTPVLPARTDLFARAAVVDYLHADRTSPFRVFGVGANFYFGYGAVADLESITGMDAVVNPYFAELQAAARKLTVSVFSDKIEFARIPASRPFHDLLNVRYYLVTPAGGPSAQAALAAVPGLTPVVQLDLDVYRSETAWPRAFFVDRLSFHRGADDFAAQVFHGDRRPFASFDTDDFRSQPQLVRRFEGEAAGRTVVAARDYRLTNHRTSFTVDAPGPGVVVLTEAYYDHDIQAEVNGRPTPVFRVNHAFRGIAVDAPGQYRVTFTYWPPHFTLSLWASGLGAVLLAATGWAVYRLDEPF